MRQCFALRVFGVAGLPAHLCGQLLSGAAADLGAFRLRPGRAFRRGPAQLLRVCSECSQVGCEELPSASGGGEALLSGDAWQGLREPRSDQSARPRDATEGADTRGGGPRALGSAAAALPGALATDLCLRLAGARVRQP